MKNNSAGRKCVFCGARQFRDIFKLKDAKLEVCSGCGLIRTNGLIAVDYDAYHRDADYKKYEDHFKNIFAKIFSDIKKIIKAKGIVLEIGCSTGILLEMFRKDGWEVWGIEPSSTAKTAKKKGIKIINTTFDKAKLPKEYFDLIILNHTLEHMENPVQALREANSLLKQHGKIFIGVPNSGSISANILGKYWPYVLPQEHRYHFYPRILERLLEHAGFRTIYEKSRSGILNLAHPIKGLVYEAKYLKKNFVKDMMTLPGAILTTVLGKGTSLTIIGEK